MHSAEAFSNTDMWLENTSTFTLKGVSKRGVGTQQVRTHSFPEKAQKVPGELSATPSFHPRPLPLVLEALVL